VGVAGDFGFADGSAEGGIRIDLNGMAREFSIELAVFDGIGTRNVRQELMHAAPAIDVHELAAKTDAECWSSAAFDFGDQCEFKTLARGIEMARLRVPLLAVKGRIEIIAADEEDTV